MSKKKQSVMEKERANFIYGNAEENVPGCISKGIDEATAGQIYDDMMDFAKYAFNKSHAACYAVVAYQTAYLKYYYPVEFMAALMTSVIDNSKKVAEYILTCRNMGIELLPPDINKGQKEFSVDNGRIRYALTAIRGVGGPIIDSIVEERQERGEFTSLKDFIERVADRDVNKRAIENFIKAGAMDSLGGTRKQFMYVYNALIDRVTKEKKNNLVGQISLFDIAGEDAKDKFDIKMPDVGEYDKEEMLAFEKEVLGIYISGHPLEEYQELWQRNISNTTNDFALDEETGGVRVQDQADTIIGGMIAGKNIKYTKNDKAMAFLNIEDLVGNVEVIVFPKDYEKYAPMLEADAKIFIRGRASVEEDKDAKLICSRICTFDEVRQNPEVLTARYSKGYGNNNFGRSRQGADDRADSNVNPAVPASQKHEEKKTIKKVPEGIWIQFADAEEYEEKKNELTEAIADSDGYDNVVIYLKNTKLLKILPANHQVNADEGLRKILSEIFGNDNVKLVAKPIEKQ
jgi:DNA polymerase-3 subunit alpha